MVMQKGVSELSERQVFLEINGLSIKRKDFAINWCWLFGALALMGFS